MGGAGPAGARAGRPAAVQHPPGRQGGLGLREGAAEAGPGCGVGGRDQRGGEGTMAPQRPPRRQTRLFSLFFFIICMVAVFGVVDFAQFCLL